MMIVIDVLGNDEEQTNVPSISAEEQFKRDLTLKRVTVEELMRRAPQPQLVEVTEE